MVLDGVWSVNLPLILTTLFAKTLGTSLAARKSLVVGFFAVLIMVGVASFVVYLVSFVYFATLTVVPTYLF
jgi:hypothetical protein